MKHILDECKYIKSAPTLYALKPKFSTFGFKIRTMITKTQILHSLESLPENVTLDQVIEGLIYIQKIQEGIDDSKNGNVKTKEEAKKLLSR